MKEFAFSDCRLRLGVSRARSSKADDDTRAADRRPGGQTGGQAGGERASRLNGNGLVTAELNGGGIGKDREREEEEEEEEEREEE